MDVRELRIGNLIVDYECEPHYFEVEEIKKNTQGNLSVYYRNGSFITVDPEPIPLTEDRLLRFRFDKCDCSSVLYEIEVEDYFIKYFNVHLEDGMFYVSVDCYGMETKLVFVEYVHQLQNLYFALTGKELELKD